MKFVRLLPPGTWCTNYAILDILKKFPSSGKTFLEIGCGAADLSYELCRKGFSGIGIDSSDHAIAMAKKKMHLQIQKGTFELKKLDILNCPSNALSTKFDNVFSVMVMEHIQEHILFLQKLSSLVKKGGNLIIVVPARESHWGIEDETVGHVRRYERNSLSQAFQEANLPKPLIWSLAVPTANILFNLSNFLISRSSETKKKNLSLKKQTSTSGTREIPFKTSFPKLFQVILNRYTLRPFTLVQRLFYKSDTGIILLAQCRIADL